MRSTMFWDNLRAYTQKSNSIIRLPLKALLCIKEDGFKEALIRIRLMIWNKETVGNYVKHLYAPGSEEQRQCKEMDQSIRFSVLVPLFNTPEAFLKEMIESVMDQTYPNWELCLADGSDDGHPEVGVICNGFAERNPNILYRKLKKNGGISENTNACIDMATGDYLVLFDHDDLLLPNALFEIRKAIEEKHGDFIYSDELVFVSPDIKNVIGIHFKPDFAPDDLLSNNYICHLTAFQSSLLKKTDRFRSNYDGSQDHELILRLTDHAENIVHIPKVLYLWRSHAASVASDINSKSYAVEAGQKAVHDFLMSKGINATVTSSPVYPTMYRVRYPLYETPCISLIVDMFEADPCKEGEEVISWLQTLVEKTAYENYHVILICSEKCMSDWQTIMETLETRLGSDLSKRIEAVFTDVRETSDRLNFGTEKAHGKYLVFLARYSAPLETMWLQEMLMYAQRENVGAVGGKLLFEDGTIRHAGIIIGLGRSRTAARSHYRVQRDKGGFFGYLAMVSDVSAVTAECMMVRKTYFDRENGFDHQFGNALFDVDFCLKLRERNLLVVFTPFAEMQSTRAMFIHVEVGHEYPDYPEMKMRFKNRWKAVLDQGDPYYNPNFTLDLFDFRPRIQ